jgi:hypothetical protein
VVAVQNLKGEIIQLIPTRQTKKRKKKERKKANKQNKQKTTPNIIIYIVPGVGLKYFILLPKIVCKER